MEHALSLVTWALWLTAAAAGAFSFSMAKVSYRSPMTIALRAAFALGVAMSLWICSAYGLWLFGVNLKLAVTSEVMAENWWLPFAIIALTCGTYQVLKSAKR